MAESRPIAHHVRMEDHPEVFRRLVESVVDYAIFALDAKGHVLSWNMGAHRLKGYTEDEVLGRHFSLFYPPEDVAAGKPAAALEQAAREGHFENEGWRVRKDGSRFWANAVITALLDDSGQLVGFTKVTRDLTARREAEAQARRLAAEEAARAEAVRRSEELARLNAQLEEQAVELETQTEELQTLTENLQETNVQLEAALAQEEEAREAAERAAVAATDAYRELDQFAYVASHDLRAPLRGIANLAQWIQDDLGDRLDGESREHMRLLQGRVRRMEALIDGILAYSRAGRRLATEAVDTGELAYKPVIGRTVRPPSPILRLRLEGDELLTTRGHPFWVAGIGWRMAKELGDGAILHGVTGSPRIAGWRHCYSSGWKATRLCPPGGWRAMPT